MTLDGRLEALKIAKQLLHVKQQEVTPAILIGDDYSVKIAREGGFQLYNPNKTGSLFHQSTDSSDAFVRLEMGPFGSGKTTTCLQEIIMRNSAMPKWHNGRKRSKWALVRNTTGELESTTLQSWMMWFDGLECVRRRQKPMLTHEYIYHDGDSLCELELLFIPLDRDDQTKKLKSLELTGVYLNELAEIPKSALEVFTGRVNRYPSKALCQEPYWSGIIADTNPPDDEHWIYKDFERAPVSGYQLFKQPPGLLKSAGGEWVRNPDADNAENLPDDYYVKLAKGKTEQFIKVFCLGQWGLVSTGKRVFPEYNDDIHSADELEYFPDLPINLAFDGGLTPACTVSQFTSRGQFRLLKEYCAEDMGMRTFVEMIVIPSLDRDFPRWRLQYGRADPACAHRDDILEEMSVLGEINSLGIECESARTNDIPPRLAAVRFFLNRMVDGHPGFILSRTGCPITRKGMQRDYVYKRLAISNDERYREVPDKNYVSHPIDTVQYMCLEFAADYLVKEKEPEETISIYNPVMSL